MTRGLNMGAKDIMEKTLEGYNDVFADIMNVLLFQGERIVRDEDLSDVLPRSYYKARGEAREQVEMFRSDFRIVADYFVQMRENENYIAPKETIEHVREVWELMAALCNDSRYEELFQGENEVTSMCEAMNQAEKRGMIKGTVATLLRLGMENNQILEEIMQQFQLDEATAREYLEEVHKNK